MTVRRVQFRRAYQIFDLEDAFARDRGLRGEHPRPLGDVRFLLVDRHVNGDRVPLDPPYELIVRRSPSGYDLFFGEVWVERPGGRRRQRLPEGTYQLNVETAFYQIEEAAVTFPMEDPQQAIAISLHPGYNYPFANATNLPLSTNGAFPSWRGPTLIRGSLYHTDGSPVQNATVTLAEPDVTSQPTYRTEAGGQWLLIVPVEAFRAVDVGGDGVTRPMSLSFSWPDPADPQETVQHDVSDIPVTLGQQMTVLQSALRGWVLQAGRAVRDATITVDGFPGQSTTRENGSWFYYFDLNQPPEATGEVDVIAVLPDGARQSRLSVPIQHGATSVVEAFHFQ